MTEEQATRELLEELERSGIPAQMTYHNKINRIMAEFNEGRARDNVRQMAQEIHRLRVILEEAVNGHR